MPSTSVSRIFRATAPSVASARASQTTLLAPRPIVLTSA